MATIPHLLDSAERAGGHRPLVTFRDLGTGERTELGVAAAANWARKTANLLTEEFGVGPGSLVGVAPFTHWLAPVLALAVWSCGAGVAEDGDAQVWFVPEERADGWGRRPWVAVGRGLGGRCTADPASWGAVLGLAEEALAFPDGFAPPDGDPGAWAVRAAEGAMRHDELERAAPSRERALLRVAPFGTTWSLALAGALGGGGGVLLVRGGDADDLARVTAEERATATVG